MSVQRRTLTAGVTPCLGFIRSVGFEPALHNGTYGLRVGSRQRSRLRSVHMSSHDSLVGTVINGLALDPLGHGVLALTRAIRFRLFERASLA